ncbi:hypothetical protein Btru_015868, partial [Bulinus truncatus]
FLMILDTLNERGMSSADIIWGSKVCRFPLFNFLRPLSLEWMYMVYMIMFFGAVGVMIGFKFRYSCLAYLICYWYIVFLEKTSWNNHSYLFGIIAFLLLLSDANRYWSLDGLFKESINNAHIPHWNYLILQAQIFLVYFIAGLKKLDQDWVFGYSMRSLSVHWVFTPFKLFLTDEMIDYVIVHLGGLIIDLFVGFLLFYHKTKPVGLVISTMFHIMNSQIFPIGMFPFVMLTSNLLFCSPSWPRQLLKYIPSCFNLFTTNLEQLQSSSHCFYQSEVKESDAPLLKDSKKYSECQHSKNPSFLHHSFSLFTIIFLALQCFLPYSHGITKGYNNWTNGLYGYSWDMMVHRWHLQHVRIKFHNKDSGDNGYLDPMIWCRGNLRWTSHGDMLKQLAECIAEKLKIYKINNVELYFDIWQSLNGRFQQRFVNPNVDLVAAEWSPFEETSFIYPLIVDLSNWREKLAQLESDLIHNSSDVVFIADFPGLSLENYIQPNYGNTTLTVLNGKVVVKIEDKNTTLAANESMQIPTGSFHTIFTVSETPSCYMYTYVYTKEVKLNSSEVISEANNTTESHRKEPIKDKNESAGSTNITSFSDSLKLFFRHKFSRTRRSFHLGLGALYCIATRNSFYEFLNATYEWERANL